MHPILFKVGPVNVYSFGLMLSLGFALAVVVAFFNAKRNGIDPWSIIDMALWLFLAGLVGSRLVYVAVNWDYYAGQSIWKLVATWEGGVSFFGAIGGGFLAVLLFARRHRLDLARVADAAAPGVALAAAVGRLGCALNGCCYGIPTGGAWGVFTRFAPGLRYPTQLFESATYFLVFLFLLWWQRRRERVPGQTFIVFVLSYLVGRGLIENLRDGERIYAWLTLTQAVGIVVAIVALVVFLYLGRRGGRHARGARAGSTPALQDEAGAPDGPVAPDERTTIDAG